MADEAPRPGVVVVLSWFGKEDTLACVESLLTDDVPATVLVVDNGSFDGTLEAVTDRWPQVQTLQTGRNLGFAGGMNAGIAWALERGAEFITVLNNDTIMPAGGIAALQGIAARGYAVCPEIYYRDDPTTLWFGGGIVQPPAAFPRHLYPAELARPVDGLRSTELVTGCCITAGAGTWRDVGLFDERFFLNFEDSEWSVRAGDKGVLLAVATDVRLLHAVSASFVRNGSSLATFYYIRNGLLFGRLGGNSFRKQYWFVKDQGPHGMADEWRRGNRRGAMLEAVEVAVAVTTHATRRYGPAPKALSRIVRRRKRTAA